VHYYTIGEFAQITGIPVKTLYFYDKKKILVPEKRNQENNYRNYSEKQLMCAMLIKELRDLDLPLTSIKSVIIKKEPEEIKNCLKINIKKLEKDLDDQLHLLRANKYLLDHIDSSIQSFSKISKNINSACPNGAITVDEYFDNWVAFIKFHTKFNVCDSSNRTFLEKQAILKSLIAANHLTAIGATRAIFLDHYSAQFFSEEGDMEIYIPILAPPINGLNFVKQIPKCTTAMITHIGGYSNLLVSYINLIEWINANGYQMSGRPIEIYSLDPVSAFKVERQITQVRIPIERAD